MKKAKAARPSESDQARLQEAQERYRKLWENVKPYVKRRKLKRHSTKGEWKVSGYEF